MPNPEYYIIPKTRAAVSTVSYRFRQYSILYLDVLCIILVVILCYASLVTYYYYYTPTPSGEFRENRKTVQSSDGDSRETNRTILKLYVRLNIIRYCCVSIHPRNRSNLTIWRTGVVHHPHCQRGIISTRKILCQASTDNIILYSHPDVRAYYYNNIIIHSTSDVDCWLAVVCGWTVVFVFLSLIIII